MQILTQKKESLRTSGSLYKVVVKSVLLHGSKTLIVTGRRVGVLEQMHHGVARRIYGRRATFNRETGMWSYPPTVEVLEVAGLLPLGSTWESGRARWQTTLQPSLS